MTATLLPVSRRRTRWRRVALGLAVMVAVFSAATARVLIWPAQGMPPRVSAIVMLNSPGNPLPVALRLARQQRAAYLLISLGTAASHYSCPRPVPGVKLICFHPVPATTQGEAEFTGRLARRYHWSSVVVVTITPQASRARLRLERCFAGPVYVMTAPPPLGSWPYQIVYQWGATIKAFTVQRSC
ncbi:MAG: YdcF family protein [Actinomycetota bacterium]